MSTGTQLFWNPGTPCFFMHPFLGHSLGTPLRVARWVLELYTAHSHLTVSFFTWPLSEAKPKTQAIVQWPGEVMAGSRSKD